MNQPNPDKIALTLIEATLASMKVVREHQKKRLVGEIKSDGTSVSAADLASEKAGVVILQNTGLDIWPEEAGFAGEFSTNEVILFDPLDGTRPFLTGAISSTVIAATYNWKEKRVTRCVVGEPISGRIWFATQDGGTWVFYADEDTQRDIESASRCTVWKGPLHNKSTVFLDLYPGFKKDNYPIIGDKAWGRFFNNLFGQTAISIFGSNGLHHALVGNGSESVAGAITTALGGPWDVAPVLLVTEAGGYAQAFHMESDGSLTEVDALDVPNYNLVVSGNSLETVEALSQVLKETLDKK